MSRRFTIIAVALVMVILLCAIVIIDIVKTPVVIDDGGMYRVTDIWVTNSSISTAIAGTVTAKAYTVTPTPTPPHRDSF